MKGLNGKSIRTVCLSLAVALAASFALAEMPGLNDGPPDMDRKMKLGQSSGVSSSAPAEQYIVTLDDTAAGDPAVQAAVIREVEALGGTVYRRFSFVLNGGFAATLPTRALETLQSNPNVAFVEPDAIIGGPPSETTAASNDAETAGEHPSIENWGMDRINQRDLPLDDYYGFSSTGAGCSVYVIDTGIRETHYCFGGRAQQKVNFANGSNEDCNGHGTHVAGIVAGIATDAQIYGVKVLGCLGSGSMSGVVSGIEWVIANAGPNSIAVLSLGGGASPTLDYAVNNMANAGIAPVVAAGNSNADACNYSPARASQALTVAASDITDSRASYSNYGSCVDIFAPGTGITSCWYSSDTATRTISGTAMAAPAAAGVLALYSCGNVSELLGNASLDKISDPMGSPNRLVYHP